MYDNTSRANSALAAVEAYAAATRNNQADRNTDDPEIFDEIASDLLGDLRHLVDHTDGASSFDSLSDRGAMHYEAETYEPPRRTRTYEEAAEIFGAVNCLPRTGPEFEPQTQASRYAVANRREDLFFWAWLNLSGDKLENAREADQHAEALYGALQATRARQDLAADRHEIRRSQRRYMPPVTPHTRHAWSVGGSAIV